jgi:hypothetical protein
MPNARPSAMTLQQTNGGIGTLTLLGGKEVKAG